MALISSLLKRTKCLSRSFATIFSRMMSSDSEVVMEKIGNKGIITLNRPKALNALNLSMIRKLYPILKAWDADPTVQMVLVKGAGEKAYCAGGDVRALYDVQNKEDKSIQEEFFREEYRLNNLIGTLQIPYVAFIHGITMGGGVGISVHGAFRVCTEKTLCAMPEAGIGFFADVGGSYFLPRLPGKIGLFLALTGYRLQGRDVFKARIATHFMTSDRLKDVENDLMRLDNPTLLVIDQVLQKYQEQCEIDYKKEFALKHVMGKINTAFDANSVEQLVQNLEKDGSDWSHKQLSILRKMSPTSLKVTFAQLQKGSKMTLEECLNMEYRLAKRFMADHDFYEGVRAVLVDKDNSPNWKPSTLQDVTDEKVNSYFAPLPAKEELNL